MKINKHLFLLGLLCCIATTLLAEGSVDFRNYPGYRAWLDNRSDQQLKVFARAGEYINVGASHVGLSGGFIKVYRPDGSLHSNFNLNNGTAIIYNDVEELSGPTGGGSTGGNGYRPGVVMVDANNEGIWTVEIGFPAWNATPFTNLLNSEPWNRVVHQPDAPRAILAWDITMTQNAPGNEGGLPVSGRVFSKEYISIVHLNGVTTSPRFNILTRDGFQWIVNFNEADPYRFPLASNSSGFVGAELQSVYSSQDRYAVQRSDDPTAWNPDSVYYYDPQSADVGNSIVNNKIFFNTPDPTMPATAQVTNIQNGSTYMDWLYREPAFTGDIDIQNLELEQFNLIGEPCPDTVYLEGLVSFSSNLAGDILLRFDADDNGSFDDPIDFAITGPVEEGDNALPWNGLNGLGVPLDMGLDNIRYSFNIRGGEIHITLGDIENNLGGITFSRKLHDGSVVEVPFYYDHSPVGGPVSGGGMPGNPQPTLDPFVYSGNFGNNKLLDYWTFVDASGVLMGAYSDDPVLGCTEDTDGDGIDNLVDLDDDNDGVADAQEYCHPNGGFACLPGGSDPSADNDFDGILNYQDASDASLQNDCTDTNNDGICDRTPAVYDTDGDNIPDHLDLDSDNDGITDLREAEHFMPDLDRNGVIDGEPAAFGQNGFFNTIASDPDAPNAVSNYLALDTDGDGLPDHDDLDSDNDGLYDVYEAGYTPLEDADNDGRLDAANVNDPVADNGLIAGIAPGLTGQPIREPRDHDGDNIPDWHDLDSDNDGIHDVAEANFIDTDGNGTLGSGTPPVDENGVASSATTSNPLDTDGDQIPDQHDRDSDNDGINDTAEADRPDADNDGVIGNGTPQVDPRGVAVADFSGPLGTTSNPTDTDGDGIADFRDLDTDNDGINDVREADYSDSDNDGRIGSGIASVDDFGRSILQSPTSAPTNTDPDNLPDFRDLDTDNDGISDVIEASLLDPDNDGRVGEAPTPVNANGQPAGATSDVPSSDSDNIPDFRDTDSDGDGISDTDECPNDNTCTNGDGDDLPDFQDPDRDNDGIADATECGNLSPCPDTDGDGIPDVDDLDSDGDNLTDTEECPGGFNCPDTDGNGTPDWQQFTCNPSIPVAELTDPSGSGSYCEGTDVQLSVSNLTPLTGELDLVWFGPNGFSFSESTTDVDGPFTLNLENIGTDAVGNYALTVLTEQGCPSPVVLFSVDLAADLATPALTVSQNEFCAGDNLLLTTQDYGNGATYLWYFDNGIQENLLITSGAPQLSLDNVQPGSAGQYSVEVIDAGCTSERSAPEGLVFSETPELNAINGGGAFCTAENTTLVATATPGANFEWTTPEGTLAGTVPGNGTIELELNDLANDQSGTYTLMVSNSNGCMATPQSADLMISSSPATPAIVADAPVLCDQSELTLATADYGTATYVWSLNGNTVATTSVPTLTQSDPATGNYAVQVLLGSCESAVSAPVEITAGAVPTISALDQGTTICTGADGQLSATIENTTGSFQFSWTLPDGTTQAGTSTDGEISLTINDATPADQGQYSLIITSENGCESVELTTSITVTEQPVMPEISADQTVICSSEALTLMTADYGTATYTWYRNGVLLGTTTEPSLTENAPQTGSYTVQVALGDCSSEESFGLAVSVEELAQITDLSSSTTACEGETGTLIATLNNNSGNVEYQWTLPNGTIQMGTTDGTEISLTILNATAANVGTYTLTITGQNCTGTPQSIDFEVFATPAQPTISTATPILCSNETLLLETTDAGPNTSYVWSFSNGMITQQLGLSTLPQFELNDPQSGTYFVQIFQNGCGSSESAPQMIEVETTPSAVGVPAEIALCEGEPVSITATVIGTDAQYTWLLPDGTMLDGSASNEQIVLEYLPQTSGTITLQLSSPNGCDADALTTDLSLEPQPATPEVTVEDNILCTGQTIVLNATDLGADMSYEWYTDNGSGFVLVATTDNPQLLLNGAATTQTGFYTVRAIRNGCASETSNAAIVTVVETPEISIDNDTEFTPGCPGETLQLSVEAPMNSSFAWSGPNGFDSNEQNPLLDDPMNGTYTVVVTTPGCTVEASTLVSISDFPEAAYDEYEISADDRTEVLPLENDLLTGATSVSIVATAQNGTASFDGTTLIYTPNPGFSGTDELTYEICPEDCPDACSRAMVLFVVNDDTDPTELDCTPPNVITPNGDNVNDAFRIPCLDEPDRFPENMLQIFNRRGDKVFEAAPYQNNWEGRYEGRDLPAGTYFYLLRLNPTDTECASGYLTITR